MSAVYEGATAPETLVMIISAGSTGVDLSTVTAAAIRVRHTTTDEEQTWTASITSQSASSITITHTFDALGAEVADPGVMNVQALLTVPGGTRRSIPSALRILEF